MQREGELADAKALIRGVSGARVRTRKLISGPCGEAARTRHSE